jgi:hypothetical protein
MCTTFKQVGSTKIENLLRQIQSFLLKNTSFFRSLYIENLHPAEPLAAEFYG